MVQISTRMGALRRHHTTEKLGCMPAEFPDSLTPSGRSQRLMATSPSESPSIRMEAFLHWATTEPSHSISSTLARSHNCEALTSEASKAAILATIAWSREGGALLAAGLYGQRESRVLSWHTAKLTEGKGKQTPWHGGSLRGDHLRQQPLG
jgi:hypothetical protein